MAVSPEKLLDILQDGMQASRMDALKQAVLAQRKNAAISIIKQEFDFTPTERVALYEYLTELMLDNHDVTVSDS